MLTVSFKTKDQIKNIVMTTVPQKDDIVYLEKKKYRVFSVEHTFVGKGTNTAHVPIVSLMEIE